MPMWLRKFTLAQMSDYYEEEAAAAKKAGAKTSSRGRTKSQTTVDFANPNKDDLPDHPGFQKRSK